MKVTVQNVNGREVTVTDEAGVEATFPLADAVKSEYVRTGEAEISLNPEKTMVTYLKMEGKSFPKKSTGFQPKPSSGLPTQTPKEFWVSQVKVFEGVTPTEMELAINEFSRQEWVIATQMFPKGNAEGKYDLFITYKVKK